MQNARNILAATDFSVLGRGVVDHALELAELLDAELNVVTVYTPVGAGPVNRETRELQEQLAELETRLKSSGRLRHAVIRNGEPAATILRTATELGADLIVMGTNNRRGFSRIALGSTAPDVLRGATVPVMVISKAAVRAKSSGTP